MNCPQCHSSMQDGFIPAGGGIFWFRREPDPQLFAFAKALPGTSSWFRRAKLEAYRCPRCELVLFRYGKQVPDPKTFTHK